MTISPAMGAASALSENFARRDARQATAADQALRSRGLDIQEKTAQSAQQKALRDEALGQIKELKTELTQAVKAGNLDGAVSAVEALTNTGQIESLAARAGVPVESILNTLNLAPTPEQTGAATGRAKTSEIEASIDAEEGREIRLGNIEIDQEVAKAKETQAALLPGKVKEARQIAEVKAEVDAAAKRLEGQEYKTSDIKGLRNDYTKLSGDFIQVRDAFGRIQTAGSEDSGPGDLALMFNYMKMLDPNSVVRESEFAQIAQTGAFGERLKAGAQQYLTGERLTPNLRKGIIGASKSLFDQARRGQATLEARFRDIASRNKVNPDDVLVIDTGAAPRAVAPQLPEGQDGEFVRRGKVNGVMMDVFIRPDGSQFGVPVNG